MDVASEADIEKALALHGTDFNGRFIKVDRQQATTGIEQSKTVFVGNLSWDVDEEQLKEFFADCGDVANVRIITDRETGQSKGFAYVEFGELDHADKATALHGTELNGRNLRINYEGTGDKRRGGNDRGGRGGGGRGGFGDRGGRGGFGDRRGGFGDRGGRGGRGGFGDRGGRGFRGGDRGGRGGRDNFQGTRTTFD